MPLLTPDEYQRLYNVDEHLRQVAASKHSDAHHGKAILTAYGADGPHLLMKLQEYDFRLAEWRLPLHRTTGLRSGRTRPSMGRAACFQTRPPGSGMRQRGKKNAGQTA